MAKKQNKSKKAVRSGSGGINSKKPKINIKIAILIILPIAALGGFFIFKKSSAVSSNRLYGESLSRKSDGVTYRIGGRGAVGIVGYENFPTSSTKVCAMVMPIGNKTGASMRITINASWKTNKGTPVPGSSSKTLLIGRAAEICVNRPAVATGPLSSPFTDKVTYTANVTGGGKAFGVSSIYPR